VPVKSYEALQKCINGRTLERAKRLGLSTSLLSKWQEPHTDFTDSGAYNPLDRIETLIEAALADGLSEEDTLAPIDYLARRFKKVVISLPDGRTDVEDLTKKLMETISEFGQLTHEASEAMKDGRITKAEAERIDREAWHLVTHAVLFLQKVKEFVR
jgi:hypothetical protein